jgi:hypothetical protein
LKKHFEELKKMLWWKYNFIFLDQNKGSMPKRMLLADNLWCKLNIILDQDIWEKLGTRLNDWTIKFRKKWAGKKEQVKVDFSKKEIISKIETEYFID